MKTRHQFGRPVGSFQALKHRLADLWVDVTQARAVARYAADVRARPATRTCRSRRRSRRRTARRWRCKAAEECVQLHGGIGFTWEHPAHLYLKRAKSRAIALGTADRHRAGAGRAGRPARRLTEPDGRPCARHAGPPVHPVMTARILAPSGNAPRSASARTPNIIFAV